MSTPTVLVTGAGGHLGGRVVELLLATQGVSIIATTRDPARLAGFAARGVDVRRADFADEASLAGAFAGAERALLVSTDAVGHRVAAHTAAIRAFERAGVRHVVYTSAPLAPSLGVVGDEHRATEAALAASSLDHTLLRNNLYADLWLQSLPAAVASGQLVDARGTGAVAWVTREDCARAAAAALIETTTGRRAHDITGPTAVTSAEVAAMVSQLVGRPVRHVSVSVDALVAGMVEHGLPEPVARVYAAFDVAIARGELAAASPAVAQLTGTPPQRLDAFLRANRAALG